MRFTLNEFRDMSKIEQAQWLAEILSNELGEEVVFEDIDEHNKNSYLYFVLSNKKPNVLSKILKARGFDAYSFADDGETYISLDPRKLPIDIFEERNTYKRNLLESQKLFERNWELVIDLYQPFKEYEENEDAASFSNDVADELENYVEEINTSLGEDAGNELSFRIIDGLRIAGNDVEEIDYILNDLYDWADEWNVWIKKDEF